LLFIAVTPIEVVILLLVAVAAVFEDDLKFFGNVDGASDQLFLIDFLHLDFDTAMQKNEPFSSLKGSRKAYQLNIADPLLLQCLVAVASLFVAAAYFVVA
jgi:hypothetical protein